MRAARCSSPRAVSTPRAPNSGRSSGVEDDGRIAWSTRVEPWESADTPGALGTATQVIATQLYRVSVEVRYPGAGGRERALELSTLKVARRDLGR